MKEQWWVAIISIYLSSGNRITTRLNLGQVCNMNKESAESEAMNVQATIKLQINQALKSVDSRFIQITPDLTVLVDQLAAYDVMLKLDWIIGEQCQTPRGDHG